MTARGRDEDVHLPHDVYRCFDAKGNLLYVGCGADVSSRMFHHLHACNVGKQPNSTLQALMDHYDAVTFPTKLEARSEERRAIATERPLLNKQHNPTRFRKVSPREYALVEPVHPITAHAFPDMRRVEQRKAS